MAREIMSRSGTPHNPRAIFELWIVKRKQYEIMIEFLSFLKVLGVDTIILDIRSIRFSFPRSKDETFVFDARIHAGLFGGGFYLRPDFKSTVIKVPELALVLKKLQQHYSLSLLEEIAPFYLAVIERDESTSVLNINNQVIVRIPNPIQWPIQPARDIGAWLSMGCPCTFWIERSKLAKILAEIRKNGAFLHVTSKPKSLILSEYFDGGSIVQHTKLTSSNFYYVNGPKSTIVQHVALISSLLRVSARESICVNLLDDGIQVWLGSHHSRTVLVLKSWKPSD